MPIEFSLDRARIRGESHLCVNPAFRGRGRRGFWIPAACIGRPRARLEVIGVERPRPGVRRYRLVIWGFASSGAAAVEARSKDDVGRAAVLGLPNSIPAQLRARPLTLFVVELPLTAACSTITVRELESGARELPARPKLCARAARLMRGWPPRAP